MKTTQRKVIEAYATLNQMGRKVSGQTAFALFRFKQQQLKPVVEFQGEEEVKLADKFGGVPGGTAEAGRDGVRRGDDRDRRG